MTPSTRNLAAVPAIEVLRRRMQSMAMLDSILEAEWEYRYFSFDKAWSDTEEMASIRNGSGDDLFAVFDVNGCFLRGFDHESVMSPWNRRASGKQVWPGVLDDVPESFSASLREPAFHMDNTTFCIWRLTTGSRWECGRIEFPEGTDPDGSGWLLSLACGNGAAYQQFATDYYEIEVSVLAVNRVFDHEPLSRELLADFPTTRGWEDLVAHAKEIGYEIAM